MDSDGEPKCVLKDFVSHSLDSDPKSSFFWSSLLICFSFLSLVSHAFALMSILYLRFSFFIFFPEKKFEFILFPTVAYVAYFVISLPQVCCWISSLTIYVCLLKIGFDLVFLLM
jgi:hypothetical protein